MTTPWINPGINADSLPWVVERSHRTGAIHANVDLWYLLLDYTDGLVQDHSNPSTTAIELSSVQDYNNPSV